MNTPTKRRAADELTELLRTLLIVQLGLAGFGQREIREVVGCDLNRVTKDAQAFEAQRQTKARADVTIRRVTG
jgi:hypothetical protein